MTNNRPYRAARSVAEAIALLREEYDRQFEGRLIDALATIGLPGVA